MEINYLKDLEARPSRKEDQSTIRGYTESEITALSLQYNNGNSFPRAYHEYLYLAGKYCWAMEGSEGLKEEMSTFNFHLEVTGIVMDRPFVTFDVTGPGTEGFYIIYLDEGVEDPNVYRVNMGEPYERVALGLDDIEDMEISFSNYINGCVLWQTDPNNKYYNP
jgi:hypothetical protein